jgi:hypothetical protein
VVLAGLAAGLAACGSTPSSSPVVDAASADEAVTADAPAPADLALAADAAPQVVEGWLARDFIVSVPTAPGPLMAQIISAVLRRNAGGDPADGRLVWLLRVEPLSETEGRLSFGVGEILDEPGEIYRFRSDLPPVVVSAVRHQALDGDAGPDYWDFSVDQMTVPFAMPLHPGGADPASVLTSLPGYRLDVSRGPTYPWPYLSVLDAQMDQQAACAVWANGINLLDYLDDLPTQNVSGDTGSVDYQTCASRSQPGETFSLSIRITTFYPINLVVDQ